MNTFGRREENRDLLSKATKKDDMGGFATPTQNTVALDPIERDHKLYHKPKRYNKLVPLIKHGIRARQTPRGLLRQLWGSI